MLNRLAVAWTLDHSTAIAPQIYRSLRERIIRADLAPGSRISETEIARAYSVSRQPVRESFIKLADQGLLSIRPQSGTFVTAIACQAVLDARFLREAIEADIVRLLAAKPAAALIAKLRSQIARQRGVATASSRDFIVLDEVFHRTLAEGAGIGGAWKLIEGLKSQMDRVRFLSLGRFPMARLIDQHEAVVDAIEARDPRRAEAAVREHLREILADLPGIVADNPGFFDIPAELPPARTTLQRGGQRS